MADAVTPAAFVVVFRFRGSGRWCFLILYPPGITVAMESAAEFPTRAMAEEAASECSYLAYDGVGAQAYDPPFVCGVKDGQLVGDVVAASRTGPETPLPPKEGTPRFVVWFGELPGLASCDEFLRRDGGQVYLTASLEYATTFATPGEADAALELHADLRRRYHKEPEVRRVRERRYLSLD